jgi:hypothetical protein
MTDLFREGNTTSIQAGVFISFQNRLLWQCLVR